MALRLLEPPDIKITKAVCGAFHTGFCYSARNPFYSGHYETFDDALEAAMREKQKDDGHRTTCTETS